jgi:hypothetical protein
MIDDRTYFGNDFLSLMTMQIGYLDRPKAGCVKPG